MVNTPALKVAVTPAGSVPAVMAAPVAPPPVVYVIAVRGVLIHIVWEVVAAADDNVSVEFALTVIVPLTETLVQGPVVVIV